MIAASHKPIFAYVIGVFFLLGGIAAASLIPAPTWFLVLDLAVGYLPMAWIAARCAACCKKSAAAAAPAAP